MTVATAGGGALGPSQTSLADVIDTILDKGLVIDAHVGVSVIGIEVLSIDARAVVASVDTYLRFAEAMNRLEGSTSEEHGLPELMGDANQRDDIAAIGAAEGPDGEVPHDSVEEPVKRRSTSRQRKGN
ncbi:gas vesicle protein [Planotetraspora sp. A-T 1434]|nr:gas vesicle protein GvpJ [Planotetraspora sp. A-T 1434]MCT9933968.1 gas vesicle protein [Planotetraspora sp. A-T 1434]